MGMAYADFEALDRATAEADWAFVPTIHQSRRAKVGLSPLAARMV